MAHDPAVTGYLFEHARDIILVIDAADGHILDANQAAESAYRCPRDELLTLTIFDLRIEELPRVTTQMQTAISRGVLFEAVHRRRDGTTFPVEVSSRGEVMAGRHCLFSIVRDISNRKELEREREQLLATTEHALAVRQEFLVIASHELRTPVTNVNLQLQRLVRLLDRPETDHAQLRSVGDAALRETGRLGGLITALIDAQVEKGQLALVRAEVDLADLVHDVVERLRMRVEQVGSDVSVEVPSLHGQWDRLRIEQVVTNLLLNALKYGGGRPIRVRAEAVEHMAQLDVIDHGIGVGHEDTTRIFGKFERAVPAHHGGLGLGLFIARQIVEAHGGTISLDSTLGAGSVFRVRLPRG
ncbi:MAG: PAS domain-containing sensor histidine kinase [Kofleriaceae bacterium]